MTDIMRAAVYRGVDDVRVESIPIPRIGPGELLIKIVACGVCATDIKKIASGLVDPPRIFGHEMAGIVTVVGAGVTEYKQGDRVVVMHHAPCGECHYCRCGSYAQCPDYKKTGTTAGFTPAGGGFAQYIRVMDWIVRKGIELIPEQISFEEATFVEPVNTVLKAITNLHLQENSQALIIGQGQIGLLFTSLMHQCGIEVFVSDVLPYRLATALSMGASEAFAADMFDVPAEIHSRTEGRGADLAVVTVTGKDAVRQAFEAVRPGGKVLLFAHTHLGDPINVDAGEICMLEKKLIGSYSSDISLQHKSAQMIFDRKLDVRRLISHSFSLEDISTALELAAHPRGDSLKVMVVL